MNESYGSVWATNRYGTASLEQFRLLSVVLRLESYDVRDVLRVLFSSRALGLAAGRAAGTALVELLIPQVV